MSLRQIDTWDEASPGCEHRISTVLGGWRYSVIQDDGTVLPFVDEGAETPAFMCIAPPGPEDPDGRTHDGVQVHPSCTCGWHFMRTRALLADYYLQPANRENHASQRRIFQQHSASWAGQVACRVEARGRVAFGAHAPDLGVSDPLSVARASHLTLTGLFLPGTVPSVVRTRALEAYPEVPVVRMTGPLHTIRDLKYAEFGR